MESGVLKVNGIVELKKLKKVKGRQKRTSKIKYMRNRLREQKFSKEFNVLQYKYEEK